MDHLLVDLGRSAVPEAWPILAAVLETAGPHPTAIQAAVDLADPRAVPFLERWLYLGDERSEAVAEALRLIPGQESLEGLVRASLAFRGRGSLVFPRIARRIDAALREREGELCTYLFEARPALRPLAAEALVALRTRDAIATVVRALGNKALHATARQHLIRIAKKDLGPRPEAWQRWLAETTGQRKENL
jgi:hypothetical protein